MSEDERDIQKIVFWDWFNKRIEKESNHILSTYETVLADAHVKARNMGLHADPEFQTTWAQVELHMLNRVEELENGNEETGGDVQ